MLFLAVGSLLFLLLSGSLVQMLDGTIRKMIYESKPVSLTELPQMEFSWKQDETDVEQPDAEDRAETEDSAAGNEEKAGKEQIPEQGTEYAGIRSENGEWSAPLYYGDTAEILQKGAGQYANGIMPGMNGVMLVSGHDSTFFAPLENVREGDKLSIRTESGTFSYTVTKLAIIEEEDIQTDELLSQEGEHLILYTCYPFHSLLEKRTQRYFVYCDRNEGKEE